MAMNNTKTLKSAKPTRRIADGVVTRWEVEVVVQADDGWKRTYRGNDDVAYLEKQPGDFTKAELIAMLNPNIDVIFDAHYQAHNTEPTEEVDGNFDVNSLS